MRKEYLDILYEQRSSTKEEVDRLVEENKSPTDGSYEGLRHPNDVQLTETRNKLFMINQLIEQYIKIHN